ncbi:MAG: gliding motility lipoprotein GldB [Flammeovirgaceae bacterium]
MKIILNYFLIFTMAMLVISCGDDEHPDVSDIQIDFKVRRVDQELRECKTKADVMALLNKDPNFSEFFFSRSQYPHDSILVNLILEFTTYEYSDTLFMDAERIYGDFSELEQAFKKAFQHIKYYYPSFEAPDIHLVVSGFGNYGFGADIQVSTDYLILGLDYFGGETATYKPPASQVPGYILRRLDKKHMVTNTMLRFSDFFNQVHPPKGQGTFRDNSLVADMVFFGKAFTFVKHMVPTANDSLIIGYRGQDLLNVHHNQVDIYTHFVKNKLFFETADMVKNKYIAEAPRVVDIADECPGRVGQWLGWQIVKHYMHEHEDITLQALMDNWNAQDIFQKSKYKPKQPER